MRKKVLSWLLIVTVIITGVMSNLHLAYATEVVDEDVFDYTLLSLSKEEELVINANGGNISGIIAISTYGNRRMGYLCLQL